MYMRAHAVVEAQQRSIDASEIVAADEDLCQIERQEVDIVIRDLCNVEEEIVSGILERQRYLRPLRPRQPTYSL